MSKFEKFKMAYGKLETTLDANLSCREYLLNMLELVSLHGKKILKNIGKHASESVNLRSDNSKVPFGLEAKLAYNQLNTLSKALREIQAVINNDNYFSKLLYHFLYHGQEVIYSSVLEYNLDNFNIWLKELDFIKQSLKQNLSS